MILFDIEPWHGNDDGVEMFHVVAVYHGQKYPVSVPMPDPEKAMAFFAGTLMGVIMTRSIAELQAETVRRQDAAQAAAIRELLGKDLN